MSAPCLTVDVENVYDGASVLGIDMGTEIEMGSGLDHLERILDDVGPSARLTLFVVGKFAGDLRDRLLRLARNHEIASHGPDHGMLPTDPDRLEGWLRSGREMVEDVVQKPVTGFRSPRFDVAPSMSLQAFRDCLERAGYRYVSDRHRLGSPASPVVELPVFTWGRVPIGGGSYQRLLPMKVTDTAVAISRPPTVLYYHSYDFGNEVPPPRSVRSVGMARLVLARRRSASVFEAVLRKYGSRTCEDVASGLR